MGGQERLDMLYAATAEYIQGRWGDTGAYLDSEEDDSGMPWARLLVALADEGANTTAYSLYYRELLERARKVVHA